MAHAPGARMDRIALTTGRLARRCVAGPAKSKSNRLGRAGPVGPGRARVGPGTTRRRQARRALHDDRPRAENSPGRAGWAGPAGPGRPGPGTGPKPPEGIQYTDLDTATWHGPRPDEVEPAGPGRAGPASPQPCRPAWPTYAFIRKQACRPAWPRRMHARKQARMAT